MTFLGIVRRLLRKRIFGALMEMWSPALGSKAEIPSVSGTRTVQKKRPSHPGASVSPPIFLDTFSHSFCFIAK